MNRLRYKGNAVPLQSLLKLDHMAYAELQLDNQICFRFYTVARLITQAYTPMLTKLGITYPQYLVIVRKKGEQDKRQQIVSLTQKGRELEEQAYQSIPAGMSDELKACPLQLDEFAHLAEDLDKIIETFKKK